MMHNTVAELCMMSAENTEQYQITLTIRHYLSRAEITRLHSPFNLIEDNEGNFEKPR